MNQQNYSKRALIAAGIALVIASVTAGYQWANYAGTHRKNISDTAAHDNSARKILYWYDPMKPEQHFDKPGKSPFMDMELQPKYAEESSADEGSLVEDNSGLRVDSNIQQNLGMRFASVTQQSLATTIDAVGTVEFNQRDLAIVQARTNGFVSRVYARATGDVISRGAPLVDLLVPEWAAAQQEFIALRAGSDVSSNASGDASLIKAARERLHLLGMPDALIKQIEHSGSPQTSVTITSPQSGVITTLNVRTGVTVSAGMTLAEINGLDSVWLNAAVPESLGGQIAVGDALTAYFPGLTDHSITGTVIAILPETNSDSRTLTLRAELPNNDGRLRPGQFARIALHAASQKTLTVPSEAIIRTGTRTLVITATGNRFNPVEVETGREANGRTEIRKGLQEGDRVVASGQFLIDSEANLTGVLSRMSSDTHQHPADTAAGAHP